MKDIFEGQPLSDKAPQGLRNKVEFTARQPQKSSWFNGGGFKWAATGTAVAATITAGALFLTPATAKSWNDVAQAYQGVKSALIRIQIQEKGAPEEILIAVKGERFRVKVAGEMDMSMNNGELLMYEVGSDEAQLVQFNELPFQMPTDLFLEGLVSEMSMANLLNEAESDIGKENIKISDTYMQDGRSVYDVAIQDPEDGMRAFVVVDANSDLPLDLRIEQWKNGQYVAEAIMSFRFNGEVDDSLLETVLPSGVKTKVTTMDDIGNGGKDFNIGHIMSGMDHGDHDGFVEAGDNEVIIESDVKLERAVIRS